MPSANHPALLFRTIGWHGWMKAAGAFNGLPRELRNTMRNASRYFISAYSRVWGVVARQVTRGRSCSRLALPPLNSAALRSRIGAESPRQTQSEHEPEILRLSSCNGPSYSWEPRMSFDMPPALPAKRRGLDVVPGAFRRKGYPGLLGDYG